MIISEEYERRMLFYELPERFRAGDFGLLEEEIATLRDFVDSFYASAARKAEIVEYLNECAESGSEINGSGSLDNILYGWTFEQALDRCLSMESKEYAGPDGG